MKALLSIKPEFAELIFSGVKKYEYRKQIFKKSVETVVVYASYPIKKVIGEFAFSEIDHDSLDKLWKKTEEYSGVSYEYFLEYFKNHKKGYAIKVSSIHKYKKPIDLKDIYRSSPPQSFAYIRDTDINEISNSALRPPGVQRRVDMIKTEKLYSA